MADPEDIDPVDRRDLFRVANSGSGLDLCDQMRFAVCRFDLFDDITTAVVVMRNPKGGTTSTNWRILRGSNNCLCLIAALHHQDISSAEAKVFSQDQAMDLIGQWRRQGLKIGFTNGCFDLLHPGHVSLLKQARKACGRLMVGLNSDASVKRLKGIGRPVQSEAARAQVLASLASVDAVVIFAEKTPIEMIKAFKPDVLVKGADYDLGTVVGADVVKKYGGKVKLAKLEPGHSTSAMIARMGRKKKL